ncbi:MAG: DUF1206 domain-containing protein, partial [Caulobacteraceae bacterium]
VYLSTGFIALLAALDLAPTPKGVLAALQSWGDWPLGGVLLWFTGLGLYGFAGWRVLQSLLDADRQGTSVKALCSRAGQAVSAMVYAGLAVAVFGLLDAIEDLREVDDQVETQHNIERFLDMPGGDLAVMTLGVFVLACGVGNLVQAVGRDFCKRLECAPRFGRRAALFGRLGYGARGVVFLPVGASILFAGWRSRSTDAKGAGAALASLDQIPMGDGVLFLLALGLMAFGVFAFVEAGFRTLPVPKAVGGPG